MDADVKEKRRERISSLKRKRWSMNSQRLEEIVAELMRPIGDLRHSFDTDLSALLEEYLTEAGLRALEADNSDSDSDAAPGGGTAPNFAELALLLQQSASIYGRKVDFLYQHVLSISDSLHHSLELANTSREEEPQTPSESRRKRKASTCGEFAHIELEPSCGARREPGAARPPPTLPRLYCELEPRTLDDHDTPLTDYDGEPIGLLHDFHVAWRLQEGLLVEELESSERVETAHGGALRPLPLVELQQALAARASPEPPPLALREDSPLRSPPHCSTPLPAADLPLPAADLPLPAADQPPPAADMPPPAAPLQRKRKRKHDPNLDDYPVRRIKIHLNGELRLALTGREIDFFEAVEPLLMRVVDERVKSIIKLRHVIANETRDNGFHDDFRGFDFTIDTKGGFPGWTAAEARLALAAAHKRRGDESDDDGFFEQSSLGDSDASRVEDSPLQAQAQPQSAESAEAAEWAAWRARAAARAAAGGARAALDVRACCAALLQRLPAAPAGAPAPARPFTAVLASAARQEGDVSRLFLAALFLANSGNVEVIQGPPLSVDSFSLRMLSADPRLYSAAAQEQGPPPRPDAGPH